MVASRANDVRAHITTASLLVVLSACGLADLRGIDPPPSDVTDTETSRSIEEILESERCSELTSDDFLCGGDPRGEWEIVVACPAVAVWDPLDGHCEELEVTGDGEAIGTLTIGASGEYELYIARQEVEVEFSFPLSCFGGATQPCNGAHFAGACSLASDVCTCSVANTRGAETEVGYWRLLREEMLLEGDETTRRAQFCRVDHDLMRLVLFSRHPDEFSWGLVLRRLP